MIEAGALSDAVGGRRVGSMFGLHGSPNLPVGCVATKPGSLLAGYSDFEIIITGTGGHAALPHMAADPIVAAAALVTGLQTIVARSVDPTQRAVISVCRIHGGDATNVIPERVNLAGTIRAFEPEVFELLTRRITAVANHTAKGFGCRAETKFSPDYPAVINDPRATAFALNVADTVAGVDRVTRMEVPVLASEDFSFYGRLVPSCFSFIGVVAPGCAIHPGLHSPHFDFTDAALETGIKMMCGYALSRVSSEPTAGPLGWPLPN
jgi:amidohydrolase